MIAALVALLLAQSNTTVQGMGKPGTQRGGVLTIQGDPTGTPINISGTISSAGAADTVGASATFNANAVCATVALAGQTGAGFFLGAGSPTETLTPSVSKDNSNWTPTSFVDVSGNTSATIINPVGFQDPGIVVRAGDRFVRVCTTAWSSGSATGFLIATTAQPRPPAAGADVTDRTGRLLGKITGSDGSILATANTGRLQVDIVTGGGSNPSVSTTGAAVPGSATYAGMNVAGNLTALTGTANGLKVDGSAVTQPVSGTVTTTPPANASTNVAQFGGTNVSTGTGAGGAGIPRITISNDSSLAANQSVNVNQVAGTATAAGNGTTTAGTQRVTLSSDSTGQVAIAGTTTVAGTVTANQGTANATPWNENIAQVAGSSVQTGNGAAAGSQRVAIANDNTALATKADQTAPTTATWTSATAADTAATLTVKNYGIAAVSFHNSGSITAGTVNFECSDDSRTTWYACQLSRTGAASTPDTTYVLTGANQLWQLNVGAMTDLRVRLNPQITGGGSAVISLQASAAAAGGGGASAGGGGGTSSSFGSAFPASGTAIGAKDSSGTNMAALNLDASGFLKVNVAAGGGAGGTSSSFTAAFPATGTAAGAQATSSTPSLANGNMVSFYEDLSGNLFVNCKTGCAAAGDTAGSSNTLSATNAVASVALAGENGASLQLTTSTSPVFTLLAECSQDGGTTYGGTVAFVTQAGAVSNTLPNPGNGTWALLLPPGCSGATNVRVRANPYTSGSVLAQLRSTAGAPPSVPYAGIVGASGWPNAALALMAQDSSTATTSRALTATANGLKVDGSAVTQPVSSTQLPAALDGSGFLKVHEQGTAAVSGTVTANIGSSGSLALDASVTGLQVSQGSTTSGQKGGLTQGAVTTAAPSYTTAQTSPLSLTTAGALRTDGSGVTQPVSGTVTTTPPSNASTNVAQVAGSTTATLAAGEQKVGVEGLAASGAAKSGNPVQVGAVFNTTQPTVTTGQAVEAQATARGGLIVATGADTFNATVSGTVTSNIGSTNGLALDATLSRAQASTTSGQTGPLVQGATTTAAPTYTTGQTDPLSLTTAGALRVDNSAVTQPVSGTVTSNQGGAPWSQRIQDGAGSTLATVTAGNALKVDGSAVTQPVSGTVTSNIGSTNGLALDATLGRAQGSTTSGQTGPIVQGAVTTSAPTYTTGQTSPLSLDTAGNLRVAGTFSSSGAADTTGTLVTLNAACGTGASCAAGSTALVALAGQNQASVALTSGASPVQTVVADCSLDGGTSYQLTATPAATGVVQFVSAAGVTAFFLTNPANGNYSLILPPSCGGATHVRVRNGAWTSGSVAGQVRAVTANPSALTWLGSAAPTVGQKASASSIPVVPASDWVEQDVTAGPTTINTQCADASINACGAGSTVQLAIAGYPGAGVKFVNSAFTCTMKADVSYDGGSNWLTTNMIDPSQNGQILPNVNFAADSTTDMLSIIAPTGASHVRVRCTTAPTNSTVVSLRASFSLGLQAVVDLVSDSTSAGTLSAACADASINSCGANQTVQIATAGMFGAAVSLPAATTLVATLKPDCSFDNGVTWYATFWDLPGGNKASQMVVASGTATASSFIGCRGASHLRVRVALFTSGTVTASLRASFLDDPSLLSSQVPGSAPPPVNQVFLPNTPFSIQSNATVSATGNTVIQNFPTKDAILIVNIASGAVLTGSPTLTYTVSEVDPGDGSTAFTGGQTITGAALSAVGTQQLVLTNIHSSSVKVAWAFTGTSATKVYATLIAKADPSYGGNATGSLTVTCPNSATSANGTAVSGFSGYKSLALMFFTKGGTGGTATVFLQYFNATLNGWVDLAVPTAAAAATQADFRGFISRAPATAAFTSFGTGGTASTAFDGVLAANTIGNGDWGDQLRLKCTSGVSTTAGVAQTVYWNASP